MTDVDGRAMRVRALTAAVVVLGVAAVLVAVLAPVREAAGLAARTAAIGPLSTVGAPGLGGSVDPGALGPDPGLAHSAGLARLPTATTQAVVVDADAADATTATVTGWRRDPAGWRPVIGPVPAHLGSAGIGAASESSRLTPTGTFGLTRAFGRAADPGSGLPYLHVGPDDWWVSDPASPLYDTHQVCARGTCPFDEAHSENLWAAGRAYDHAIVVDANTAPVRPGGGSAYFLHIGDGPTAGCVATDDATVTALLRWLTPAAHPAILLGVGAPA